MKLVRVVIVGVVLVITVGFLLYYLISNSYRSKAAPAPGECIPGNACTQDSQCGITIKGSCVLGKCKCVAPVPTYIPSPQPIQEIVSCSKVLCENGQCTCTVAQPTSIPRPSFTPAPTRILTPTPTSLTPTPKPQVKRVFITSNRYRGGEIGGLNGADTSCNDRALAVNLGGAWKAWLSSDTVSAGSRLSHSEVLYKRIDDQVVAQGWSGLTSGKLQNPINITELKTVNNSSWVWTNTFANGTIRQTSGSSCVNWTSTSSGGSTGDSTRTDSGWSDYGAYACQYSWPLYCIEQ